MIRAILIHVLSSVFIAAALSTLVGHLNPMIAGVSLAAGFLIALASHFKIRSENEPSVNVDSFFSGTVFFMVALIILRHTLYLFFEIESQIKTLNTNNFGDLTMHIGILKNLAAGDKFWPEFVSLAGHPLQYPFGVDFYNALWEAVGVPTQSHLFFTGSILLLCLMFTAYWWLGILGVIGIFFNGGWQGFEYLWTGVLRDYQNPWAWKNFFLTLLIPQRGFLMGLPVGIYILKKMTEFFFDQKTLAKNEKYILWFMWAMLPIFHMHSFIAITLLIGFFALANHKSVKPILSSLKKKENLFPFLLSGVLATAWTLKLTGFFQKASIIHTQKGWNMGDKSIFQNIFGNYGPWLFLLLFSVYFVMKKRWNKEAKLLLVGFGMFLIFQFVMMAPWEWDNIKILIWPYLVMVFVMSKVVTQLHEQIRVPLYMTLGFSGFVCVIALSNVANRGHGIYDTPELIAAAESMKLVPANAVFAATPTFNHALTYYGKKVAFGYDGHIWSHGLDGQRKEKVESLLRGDPNWKDLAHEMGITHIYWGPKEKKQYILETQPWKSLKNLSISPEVSVYAIE